MRKVKILHGRYAGNEADLHEMKTNPKTGLTNGLLELANGVMINISVHAFQFVKQEKVRDRTRTGSAYPGTLNQ